MAPQVGDLVRSWDDDGNGAVDREEFRTHVLGLGFKAEVEELDGIFEMVRATGARPLRTV